MRPGREELVRPGPQQEELVLQIKLEWARVTGEPMGDFPWRDGQTIRTYIEYRKECKEGKHKTCKELSGTSVIPFSPTSRDGYVYFIENTESGNIKIGWAKSDPEKRRRTLQTGNDSELRLLGWIPGSKRHEGGLHLEFAKYRIRRDAEWFETSRRLREYIKEHCERP